MKIQQLLWLNWLEMNSFIRRKPFLIYLVAFIFGSLLWRVFQIKWHWWQRELNALPYGILIILISLLVLSPIFWRFKTLLFKKPSYLILLLLFICLGYGYTQHCWLHHSFPLSLEKKPMLTMVGKVIQIEGNPEKEIWQVRTEKMITNAKTYSVQSKVQLFRPRLMGQKEIKVGDQVLIKGQFAPFSKATNPGQFDYARYQRYLGVLAQGYEPELTFLARPQVSLIRWLGELRSRALALLDQGLSLRQSNFLKGLLTGEDTFLAEAEQEKIRNLGLSHVLAISGLHLGLVVELARRLCQVLPFPRKYHSVLRCTVLWFSVIFVGAPPSALRVGVFLSLREVADYLNRPTEPIHLLSLTAWVILLVNPLNLFLLSFQLSFGVYLSILLLTRPLQLYFAHFLPSFLQGTLALSMAAFVGSAPILLFTYFEISLSGLLMNLWAVPLIGGILMVLLFSLGLGGIYLPAGIIVNRVLGMMVELFLHGIDFFAKNLTLRWQPGRPLVLWMICFYLAIIVFVYLSKRKEFGLKRMITENKMLQYWILSMVLICGFSYFSPLQATKLEWVALDVGQGDSFFLRLPGGTNILIDGGGRPGQSNHTGEQIIRPFLLSRGVTSLDLICVSHFDADHVQGLLPILEEFEVKEVWTPQGSESDYAQSLHKIIQKRGITLRYLSWGQIFQFPKSQLKILHPLPGENYDNENDRSLVILLASEGRKILFTGDLGEEVEERLLKSQIRADLLKVSHHGSKYSTSKEFLDKVQPCLALISVGTNLYGHPAKEVLQRLKETHALILRTDHLGAIQIKIKKGKIKIEHFNR